MHTVVDAKAALWPEKRSDERMIVAVFSLGIVLAFFATSCWAQITQQDVDSCWSRSTAIPAQERVQNCTQLINSGKLQGYTGRGAPVLPKMYLNRGLAHHELGELDEAIDDFSRAIELDPGMAEGYF